MKQIFLVDDSAIVQLAVTAALAEAGFATTCAATFDELMTRGTSGCDLLLMDVHMPELFGDDVAMVLRERGITMPIYLYSGLAHDELAERAKSAGVDGYIHKGDGLEHLVARVREILAGS
jgi:two-component system response regulator FimZ (fimbrial Z protein)